MVEREPYYVRPLDETFFILNKNKQTSDKRIDIIPQDKPFFEFISFIEFANITYYKYKALELINSKFDSISIELYDMEPFHRYKNLKYSFKIEIGSNFSNIHIFMKYYINDFTSVIENGQILIKISCRNMISSKKINYYHYSLIITNS